MKKTLIINESIGDIFYVKQGYYLVHAISGDFSLGAGFAKLIDENYNMKEKLNQFYFQQKDCFRCLLVDNVFNLVIKNNLSDTAEYENIRIALLDMKNQMEYLNITKLAMPKICTGREKLDWNRIKTIIEDIFVDYSYNLEINIVNI